MILAHVRSCMRRPGRPGAWPPPCRRSRARHDPDRWLDLEGPAAGCWPRTPREAHNSALFRTPLTTLDAHLAAGLRVAALAELVEGFDAARTTTVRTTTRCSRRPTCASGRRSCGRPACATSTPSKATWRRCGPAAATPCPRRGTACRSSTSATSPRSAGRATRSGPRAARPSSTTSSRSAPWSTRRPATCPPSRPRTAIGGYLILNDWSARDLQREETTVRLGPAKGKDFASSIGPWLVTPDELADARAPGASGPELSLTRRGQRRRDVARQLVRCPVLVRRRCSPGPRPTRPSGRATWSAAGRSAAGCLLEVREATLGRYLEPGDEVILRIERLGALATPIVARPA